MRTINIYRGYEILESIERGSLSSRKFKQFKDLKNGNYLNYSDGELEIQEKNGLRRSTLCSDIIHKEFEELNGIPVAYPTNLQTKNKKNYVKEQ